MYQQVLLPELGEGDRRSDEGCGQVLPSHLTINRQAEIKSTLKRTHSWCRIIPVSRCFGCRDEVGAAEAGSVSLELDQLYASVLSVWSFGSKLPKQGRIVFVH
ncbi:MAG: hypothetical protein ACYC27_15800 [Armatimonadota bacterium]